MLHMVDSRKNRRWLSGATNFGVAIITFAAGIVASLVWTADRAPRAAPPPPPAANYSIPDYSSAEIGTLKRAILEAKARGENTVEFGVIGCGSEIGSLRASLWRDTIVVADLVGKKTYADTWGLRTWYRFKTKETLVEHRPPRLKYSPFQSAPSEMLPIAEDEFLIQEANGQMEIDGVTVKQFSNGAKYKEGQTYLLFLSIDPSTRTAIHAGTDALDVFLVDNDGNITPYLKEPNHFSTDLGKRFKNSLNNMREALKK